MTAGRDASIVRLKLPGYRSHRSTISVHDMKRECRQPDAIRGQRLQIDEPNHVRNPCLQQESVRALGTRKWRGKVDPRIHQSRRVGGYQPHGVLNQPRRAGRSQEGMSQRISASSEPLAPAGVQHDRIARTVVGQSGSQLPGPDGSQRRKGRQPGDGCRADVSADVEISLPPAFRIEVYASVRMGPHVCAEQESMQEESVTLVARY